MAALSGALQYSEGTPGARYYGGNVIIDQVNSIQASDLALLCWWCLDGITSSYVAYHNII